MGGSQGQHLREQGGRELTEGGREGMENLQASSLTDATGRPVQFFTCE